MVYLYGMFCNYRIHREIWDQFCVDRVQEESQRRDTATEDSQDLYCKTSPFIPSQMVHVTVVTHVIFNILKLNVPKLM